MQIFYGCLISLMLTPCSCFCTGSTKAFNRPRAERYFITSLNAEDCIDAKMNVDVKAITVYVRRFSIFFAGICFRFAQKHPCISGTMLSIFGLYIFFPLVFKLLFYSSPIMVWVYASRKNIIKSEHSEALIENSDDQMNNGNSKWVKVDGNVLVKKRYVKFSVQNGRIDAMAKNKESADYVPKAQHKAHGQQEDGVNKAISESESDIIGKAKNDLKKAENNLKKTEDAETVVDDLSKANEKSEAALSKKAEYEEKKEDDAPGDEQTAVECTKQAEKNLMDLETSETERDRRLDSLIQKRRARKLLSMQVRTVIDIMRHPQNQIAPLVIARSTGPLNLINTLSDTDDLHMPGSAPSVLLPTRSPFDLPYDPFEERPNLTGDDSFQQEFINAERKYVFLGGPFGQVQDGNTLNAFMNKEKNGMARHGFSRFRSYRERVSYESLSPGASSGEHELTSRDDIIVHDSSCEEHSLNQPTKSDNAHPGNHAESENIQTGVNFEESNEKCNPASLNEKSCEEGCQVAVEGESDNQVEGAKADSARNTASEDLTCCLHKSLTSTLQELPAKEAKKDLFNVHKRVLHTPAHSIASDLVVEVSESGSPPPTLSPPDGDSSQYDGDVDRDISSSSEDMSMHVYRTEDLNSRGLEGHQSGKDGLALEESIPEAIDLEHDVLDGYEHTSQNSSDDDSSYENVVQHLNEKLKARQHGNAELSSPASAESSAATSYKHIEQETGLMNSGTSAYSRELERHSSPQDHRSVKESLLPIDGAVSHIRELPEVVPGGTEMRSSVDISLPDTQQAQAEEELPQDTSPNSVLPDTDSRDLNLRSETQALPDNQPDVFQPEDSIPRTSENQDSERDIEEANRNVRASENQYFKASVIQSSLDTQDDLFLPSVCVSNDESSGLVEKNNALCTYEISQKYVAEGHLEQKPAISPYPPAEADLQDEAHAQHD